MSESQLLIVTGMSGAGRSTAARALEDQGWFVIDNLPPPLLPDAWKLLDENPDVNRVAVILDVRAGGFFADPTEVIGIVRKGARNVRVLYLDATNEVLVKRYEANRRPHPLQVHHLLDGITRERSLLAGARADADLIIDTSNLNVHELRRRLDAAFAEEDSVRLRVTVMSFGFKYGIPADADLVADVRFLPNPYWVEELRPLTGQDSDVNDYVFSKQAAVEFLDQYARLIDIVAEGYLTEGKRYVNVAVGCTGGKHRSVAMAENLAARLVKNGVETFVLHRDLGRE